MGPMHVIIIRRSEHHLKVTASIGFITPPKYYMILPARGIGASSATTILLAGRPPHIKRDTNGFCAIQGSY